MTTPLRGVFPVGVPIVIVNYKIYAETTGARAVALTRSLEEVAKGARVTLAIAPQAADISRVADATDLVVLAQHVDPNPPGPGTGATLAEAVREAGAVGSLLDHAERRLDVSTLGASVLRLRAAGLASVVCANDVAATRAAAAMRPDLVAIEPPQLIGGDVSVTTADPGIVREAVQAGAGARVLCGAGVKTGEDVKKALELGAAGVLLATGVLRAKAPAAALAGLLRGLP